MAMAFLCYMFYINKENMLNRKKREFNVDKYRNK